MTASKVHTAPPEVKKEDSNGSQELLQKKSDKDTKLSSVAARSASQNLISSIKQDLYANNLTTQDEEQLEFGNVMKSRQKTIPGTVTGSKHDTIPRAGGSMSREKSNNEIESMKMQA